MSKHVDLNLHAVMRSVSVALKLDNEGKSQEAYSQYLRSSQYIIQSLLLDTEETNPTCTASTKKFIKLGQQCLDRVEALATDMQRSDLKATSHHSKPAQAWQFSPAKSLDSTNLPSPTSPSSLTASSPAKSSDSSSLPSPTSPSSLTAPSPSSLPNLELGPTEQARRQNKQLMAAYKARLGKVQAPDHKATDMSLTLQRRLVENMAIAQAREDALRKKIQERHLRLQEEAARSLASTIGMSKDEQERRQLYTKILEYENDNKWLLNWREKLRVNPSDSLLAQNLIWKILGLNNHPLMQLLYLYQYKVYNKVEPLLKRFLINMSVRDKQPTVTPQNATGHVTPGDVKDSKFEGEKPIETGLDSLKHDETNLNLQRPHDDNQNIDKDNISADLSNNQDTNLEVQTEDQKNSVPLVSNGSETNLPDEIISSTIEDLNSSIPAESDKGDSLSAERNTSPTVASCHDDMSKAEPRTPDYAHDGGGGKPEVEVSPGSDQWVMAEIEEWDHETAERLELLEKESLQKHLRTIVVDVHDLLEKVQGMFIVAYEQLDSPAGRDLCYSCIERPFFTPIWKYLIALFRLVDMDEERRLSDAIDHHNSCTPEDFGVSSKLRLDSEECLPNRYSYPYEPAVKELQAMIELSSPLTKLESIVRVSRVVCKCVDDYYSNYSDSTTPSIGADDLLPLLAYVIVKSGFSQLVPECHALEEFIHEGYLMGEEGYCLTSLQTALYYVISLDTAT